MQLIKKIFSIILFFSIATSAIAQFTSLQAVASPGVDTMPASAHNWKMPVEKRSFPVKSFIIPATLITYGFTALESDGLKDINEEVKEEIWDEKPHKLRHADTYLMFAPAVSVYALNAFGIHGKSNLRDRSMIYLLSNIFQNAIIYPAKKLSHSLRPNGSNYNSFPSGHTSTAFASAEFLRMEYKDVSPWYGVAGYMMAATTGYLRMYNNKHWLSDVVAGAGVGIASTKLAYWLYPKIQHVLFKDKVSKTVILPGYQNGSFTVGLTHQF